MQSTDSFEKTLILDIEPKKMKPGSWNLCTSMFTAGCPLMDEWIKRMWKKSITHKHTHTHEYTGIFSSVSRSCPTLCDLMDCSTPGFPVHQHLLELAPAHVHWVSDAIQPSHPLSSPSLTFNLSQHQGLFKWVSSSHQVAKVLEFQLQHQSFQWMFRTDFL